jgi:hypothetical protein
MSTLEVGKKLVELCRQGKHMEAIDALYSPEIVSIEAASSPNMPQEMKGLDAIHGKNKWWMDNHVIHSANVDGPYPHGDRFIVTFAWEVTNKPMNQRFTMAEAGLYTVRDDKIVREEFFYNMGG